ncbi:MAG: hypothetical protein R3185_03990 [Candidatus Thermoplasmatota archaeon]|nr:hypothetical protein [Candidatus Thermoplasmatota archaeon]
MAPRASPEEVHQALQAAGKALEADLQDLFSLTVDKVRVSQGEPLRLEVEGPEGRFAVTWPPQEQLTHAQGRLGAHGRIAWEFHLAQHDPTTFFPDHWPVSPERRDFVFERLAFYIEDTLGETGFYDGLIVEVRGDAMLVYYDDEYVLISSSGQRRGNGLLDWKLKRLLAYTLTDADEHFGT